MGNRNTDVELPTIINSLAHCHIGIEQLTKQLHKGQFLVAREELQSIGNHLGIVSNYIQASVREKLNYQEDSE